MAERRGSRNFFGMLKGHLLTVLVVLMLAPGCVGPYVRTPLRSLSASDELQRLSVGILHVAVVPAHVPQEVERHFLFFPGDEVLVKQGEDWAFIPSGAVVPVTDFLLISLRSAGLNIDLYPSLRAAQNANANLVIIGVLPTARITVKTRLSQAEGTSIEEADAELYMTILEAKSARPLWTGALKATVRSNHGWLPVGPGFLMVGGPAGATRGAHELLVQAYYHLAMQLVSVLERVRKTGQ